MGSRVGEQSEALTPEMNPEISNGQSCRPGPQTGGAEVASAHSRAVCKFLKARCRYFQMERVHKNHNFSLKKHRTNHIGLAFPRSMVAVSWY